MVNSCILSSLRRSEQRPSTIHDKHHDDNNKMTSYTPRCYRRLLLLLGMLLLSANADYNPNQGSTITTTICPAEFNGYLPTADCKKYFNCWKGEKKFEIACPEGQLYDTGAGYCVDESLVTSCDAPTLHLDIVSDQICSTVGTGKQGLSDCTGFAVCDSGFMMEMVTCDAGSLYDESTENCSVDKTSCGPQSPPPTTGDEPSSGSGEFYPNWSTKQCDEKTSSQGLGVYYGYYDSRNACCSHNFITSIQQLESCMGSTLAQLFGEPQEFPDGTGYVPEWGGSGSCVLHTISDESAAWMKHSMKSKKCECCFEYMSWDLLRCMTSDASR